MRSKNIVFRAVATCITLTLLISGGIVPAAASNKLTTVFRNCIELKKFYKNGVSVSAKTINKGKALAAKPTTAPEVFRRNSKLDLDRDGIICEREMNESSSALGGGASNNNPGSTTETSLVSIAKPLSECQLKETKNYSGAGAKGFPARQEIPSTGTVKVAIVPIDFENAVGTGSPAKLFDDDVKKIKEWASYYSRGRLNYDVEFHGESWIRAPKGAEWYTCVECHKGATEQKQPMRAGVQDLINASDKTYEFKKTEIIYFVFPAEAEEKYGTAVYSHKAEFNYEGGKLNAAVYGELGGGTGARPDRSKIWDHAAHEFLHFQGFIGHGPENGSPFYITTNQWGISKSVTSWEAFLNGWFGESEVLCVDASDIKTRFQISMSSIDEFGNGYESLMVKLNDSELIAIERRQSGRFSEKCSKCRLSSLEGFTAYRVNVNKESYRNDSDPDSESKNFWAYLRDSGQIKLTRGVSYQGIDVTPMSSSAIQVAPSEK